MISELTILANRLDSKGRIKEADYLDGIIRKLAEPPPLSVSSPEEEVPHPSLWERIFPAAHKRHALRGLVGWDELGALPGGKEIKKKMRQAARNNPDMSTEEFAAMIQDELSVLRVGEETIVPETQIGTAAISYVMTERDAECPEGHYLAFISQRAGMKGCCPDGWRDTGTHCESPNSLTETDHEGHDHGFQ